MKKLAMMAFLAVSPAQADVIFFTEARGEPGVRVTAQVTVSDAAFAAGLDVNRAYDSRRVTALHANRLDGLLGLDFRLSVEGAAPFRTYALADFLETSPSVVIPYRNVIQVVSAPSGLPKLEVSLLNFQDLFSFSFDATSAMGAFGAFATDAPSPCFRQPNTTCQFTGTSPVVVSVPAPAALGVFSLALLGLALLHRRPASA